MNKPPSYFDRIASLSLVCFVVIMMAIFLIIPLFQQPKLLRLEHDAALEELAKFRQTKRDITQELQSSKSVNITPYIWNAEKSGELNARLQAQLGTILKRTGANLKQVISLNSIEGSFGSAATLRIEAVGDLAQINRTLLEIEKNQPALFIENFLLRNLPNSQNTGPQPFVILQADITAPSFLGGGQL